MLGALQLAKGNHSSAQRQFALISTESPLKVQSQWLEAKYLLAQSDTSEEQVQNTIESLQTMADLEHPFDHGDAVLSALIERSNGSEVLYPLYRELWASYPYSKYTKNIATKLNALEKQNVKFKASSKDWSKRASQQMAAWQWKTLISELAPIVSTLKMDSAEACAVRYAYGRAHFKINSVTKASQLLPKVGKECNGLNDDVGAKAWYLIGKSYERKKLEMAEAYQKIPEMYPEHSMADDGYAGRISFQEVGDMETAFSLWEQQVKTFPEGLGRRLLAPSVDLIFTREYHESY